MKHKLIEFWLYFNEFKACLFFYKTTKNKKISFW